MNKNEQEEETAGGLDRISNLPDSIIHHILSFLDTKSAVQTCILSKHWESAWKHVHSLNLELDFDKASSYERFVEKVLSLRYPLHVSNVHWVTYPSHASLSPRFRVLRKVVQYAVSHGAQSFVLQTGLRIPLLELFDSISDTVTSLEFGRLYLDCQSECSAFRLLTTLKLHDCCFLTEDELVEPFSQFPCLKDLALDDFSFDYHQPVTRLRISGLELVSLRLANTNVHKLEIFAPKLESLRLDFAGSIEFSELTLPSLVHADIGSDRIHCFDERNVTDREHLVSLFRGLHNVESLKLCYAISKAVRMMSKFLGQQPCPFTKLKKLSLGFDSDDDIPREVVDSYFLNASLVWRKNPDMTKNRGKSNSIRLQLGMAFGGVDRISNLPDFILHHILSFLDTRSAVQTCVLSKHWESAWKHVEPLNLELRFNEYSRHERFVDNFLSLRYPLHVSKVSWNTSPCFESPPDGSEFSLLRRIVQYAVSHGAQHFDLSSKTRITRTEPNISFLRLFDSISDTVRSLRLDWFQFHCQPASSAFWLLTKLKLFACWFSTDNDELVEPFSQFPCLKDLSLDDCVWRSEVDDDESDDDDELSRPGRLRVFGLELDRLCFQNMEVYKLEIFAPKLKSFKLCGAKMEFSELTLPSLLHADIEINEGIIRDSGVEKEHMVFMFHGLRNVKSLKLCIVTIHVVNGMSEFLVEQPCPFTQLQKLKFNFDARHYDLPLRVLNSYFFNRGSNARLNIQHMQYHEWSVMIERLP
ncbi:Putative F-box/LRR-repeat protein At5g02930 [Linum grandiflorum]